MGSAQCEGGEVHVNLCAPPSTSWGATVKPCAGWLNACNGAEYARYAARSGWRVDVVERADGA